LFAGRQGNMVRPRKAAVVDAVSPSSRCKERRLHGKKAGW